jgi:hypothetical protein
MVVTETNKRGLLPDEQFGSGPRHSTTLQLACVDGSQKKL